MAIRDCAYRCCSIVLLVHEFGEIVCPLSIAGLEREIYFSRFGENVAQFVVLPKKIGIRKGGIVEPFEHRHCGRIPRRMSEIAMWTKPLARRTLPRARRSAVEEGLKEEVSWATEKGGPCDPTTPKNAGRTPAP
jgi:hypothetical protein